jgi:hypothetical protein
VLTLDDLIRDQPKFIEIAPGALQCEALAPEILRHIATQVSQESATLETGSGASTVLFAIKHTRHIAITPAAAEVERITAYCRAHGLEPDRIRFVIDFSEHALPILETPPLDLVVIDGRHGFPAPFIDWYYTAPKLKLGGLVVIDDTWTFACQILRDFLLEAPEWELVYDLAPRAAIFKKLKEGSETQEWVEQPYINNRGQIIYKNGVCKPALTGTFLRRKALDSLKRGELLSVAKKVFRTLTR